MVGPRDIGWGIVLGVLLVLAAQGYPLWRAERTVARDAAEAFGHVFEGRRMHDGTLVQPEGAASAPQAFAPPIYFRRLDVSAAQVDWNGKHVSLLFKHVVGYDETLDEVNPTHEVLVRLEKQGGAFVYTQFQVRGLSSSPLAIEGNPWFPLMHAAAEAERRNAPSKREGRGIEVTQ